MERAIVLLSGGMDSSTLLYTEARMKGAGNVLALIFDYGRLKHDGEFHSREVEAAIAVAEHASVSYRFIQIGSLPSCPLTTSAEQIPDQSAGRQVDTVVPGRNTILLSYGLAYAQSLGERATVFFGACSEDDLSYPDCRESYVEAMSFAFMKASEDKVEVKAPFVNWTKKEILQKGLRYGVPYSLTYTCYRGRELSCGLCDACVERIKAFQDVGVTDPLEYENEPHWSGCVAYDKEF